MEEKDNVNLCSTCKHAKKCKRLFSIHQTLMSISMEALEDWFIDIDINYNISDCLRYTPDFGIINFGYKDGE